MNINQLRYFIAAAECQSFSKAASQYYISQTAITQQIHSLEEKLGVKLFSRDSRPLALTPAGISFLRDAKAIVERMERAAQKVHQASVGFMGELKIGYSKGFERSNLSDVIRSFHSKFPNVFVSCYRCDTDQLSAGIFKDRLDIILTWDSNEINSSPDIQTQLMESSPLVAALYPNHPLAQRNVLSRSDFKNENILFMTLSSTGNSPEDMTFYQFYQDVGYQPNIIFRSNDVESILMMVAAEQGVSLLPSYATKKLINAENLVFIPLKGENECVNIIAAWKKDSKNPILHHFCKHISNI